MNNVKYKEQLTRIVLDHSIGNAWSYEEAIKKWWFNPRGGLRLTQVGDLEFRFAKIEYYDHDFQVSKKYSWYAFILDLDKKIKCPYYIDVNKSDKGHKPFIRLYDSRISMLLKLYGDIDSYLHSIKVKK